MTNLDTWYARLDADSILEHWRSEVSPAEAKRFEEMATKARVEGQPEGARPSSRDKVDGEFRIISDPPLVVPLDELAGDERRAMSTVQLARRRFRIYRHSLQPDRRRLLESYRLVDFARKVVGVGSVGTRCWIALMIGQGRRRPAVPADQGGRGVGARALTRARAGTPTTASASSRASGCSRRRATSSWAGSIRTGLDGVERDFYIRQLWDWKVSADLETMTPEVMKIYAPDVRLDAGTRPRPLRRPRRHRRVPRIAATCSTRPSPTSPPPTPTRTSATSNTPRSRCPGRGRSPPAGDRS